MRKLKFRAFSKSQKRMFPVYGLGIDWITEDTLDGVDEGQNCFSGSDFMNDIIVMQFTELKAKGDINLFFEDIVEWNDGSILRPSIRRAKIVSLKGQIGFEILESSPTLTPGYVFEYGRFAYKETELHLKVIGNIYENKELNEI
jgi:hypothetical protein